jgi:hypothetical protein
MDQIQEIRKDVEDIYLKAMEKESYSIALKAKELLGREHGLFKVKTQKESALENISDQVLSRLIGMLEKQLTEKLDPES